MSRAGQDATLPITVFDPHSLAPHGGCLPPASSFSTDGCASDRARHRCSRLRYPSRRSWRDDRSDGAHAHLPADIFSSTVQLGAQTRRPSTWAFARLHLQRGTDERADILAFVSPDPWRSSLRASLGSVRPRRRFPSTRRVGGPLASQRQPRPTAPPSGAPPRGP